MMNVADVEILSQAMPESLQQEYLFVVEDVNTILEKNKYEIFRSWDIIYQHYCLYWNVGSDSRSHFQKRTCRPMQTRAALINDELKGQSKEFIVKDVGKLQHWMSLLNFLIFM